MLRNRIDSNYDWMSFDSEKEEETFGRTGNVVECVYDFVGAGEDWDVGSLDLYPCVEWTRLGSLGRVQFERKGSWVEKGRVEAIADTDGQDEREFVANRGECVQEHHRQHYGGGNRRAHSKVIVIVCSEQRMAKKAKSTRVEQKVRGKIMLAAS